MATARKSALGKGLGKGLDSLITDKVGMNKQPETKTAAPKKNEKSIDGILVNINKIEPTRITPRKLMAMMRILLNRCLFVFKESLPFSKSQKAAKRRLFCFHYNICFCCCQ